jgi:hypothetical protein
MTVNILVSFLILEEVLSVFPNYFGAGYRFVTYRLYYVDLSISNFFMNFIMKEY